MYGSRDESPPPPPPSEPYPGSSSSSNSQSREPTRERRSKRDRSFEREKKKTKVKPMTLGELVEKTASSKRKPEKRPREESPKKGSTSVPSSSKNEDKKDEMPFLTEEDLREQIIMNPDEPFDPKSMRVTKRPSSTKILANGYLKVDDCVYSSLIEREILNSFNTKVLQFCQKARESQPQCPLLPPPPTHASCKCGKDDEDSGSESSSFSSSEDESNGSEKKSTRAKNKEQLLDEIHRKKGHPAAVDPSLVFNESGMTNDGPVCRCPNKTRTEGIRHHIFMGEEHIRPCNPRSNNADRLHHYVLHVNNAVNQSCQRTSTIKVGQDVFTFRGFSVFFHHALPEVFPRIPISRWNTDIEFEFIEEPVPENFTVGELDSFTTYLLEIVLELYDFPRFPSQGPEGGCPVFHVMPRYTTYSEGSEVMLSMGTILDQLTKKFEPMLNPIDAVDKMNCPEESWARFANNMRSSLLINPFKRPATLRVDNVIHTDGARYPTVVHSTLRCPAYLSIHLAEVQSLQKKLNKMRKTMRMKKTPSRTELKDVEQLQRKIEDMKAQIASLRPLKVTVSAEEYYKTGFVADIVSHVLTLSVACFHARLHMSFDQLEERIKYKFSNRGLLELAMIHPSFKNNYGMTADHARNTILTCGYKNPIKGEKMEDFRKLGGHPRIAETIRSGDLKVKNFQVVHNERLEYLGDAVVEMLVTVHLFFMLPQHQEGGLATYRSALVQNRNLAALAQRLGLQHFLLFTHGPDLCHDDDFRHALANAFEAVMGAIYLDKGLEEADRIFSAAMWGDDADAKDKWDNMNDHELKENYPDGDRDQIDKIEVLKSVSELEEVIGYRFNYIRILAKAMTRRCIPMNDITKGHNQRLEWLGDTVLQLIVSDYLYRHFPFHHEGHLSLLRTCIVSNKTQSIISDELCLQNYCIKPSRRLGHGTELKMKDKADLVESLIGAIYVDGGLDYCEKFVKILFLPRLKFFLVQKRWSDDKSKLQHACLAFRSGQARKPECPVYRMLSQTGPTNSRVYTVGVFFRGKKLAEGTASNLHNAEMEAAKNGLESIKHLLGDQEPETTRRNYAQRNYRPSDPNSPAIPSLMSCPIPQTFTHTQIAYIPVPVAVTSSGVSLSYGFNPFISQPPPSIMAQPPQPLMQSYPNFLYQPRR